MKSMDETTKKEMQEVQLPEGWRVGDTCVMITNKKNGYTGEYTITSYDGRYFGVKNKLGYFYHASLSRLFHTREEAIAFLKNKGGAKNEVSE
jgi:hypothetical protein